MFWSSSTTLLHKKDSIEIHIVSKFSERFNVREFSYEKLIIEMYNTQESIEIFRKDIRNKFTKWSYMNGNYNVRGYGDEAFVDNDVTLIITSTSQSYFMLSVSFLSKLLSNYDKQIFVVQCDTISKILVLLSIIVRIIEIVYHQSMVKRSNLDFSWYFFTCKKLKLFCTWCLDSCLYFVFHMLFFVLCHKTTCVLKRSGIQENQNITKQGVFRWVLINIFVIICLVFFCFFLFFFNV